MENKQEKHLTYFKVEYFKGLESLELKNVQKFNLILGDNNIGKTSVLEALMFDESPFMLLRRLYGMMSFKGLKSIEPTDFFNNVGFLFSNEHDVRSIKYSVKYDNSKQEEYEISLIDTNDIEQKKLDNLIANTFVDVHTLPSRIISYRSPKGIDYYTLDINLHRIKKNTSDSYFPFIKSGLAYDTDLVQFFSSTVNNDLVLRQEFISNLHFLSSDIAEITIDSTTVPDTPILMVLFSNGKKPIPLFMMGDGTIRMVRLILEIIMCKDSRLMIDEIDNGMHFSKMKNVWEIVLRLAVKYNTQLFVTTHDSECLRAFKEVLEESKDLKGIQGDVASYTLFRNKKGIISSVRYSFQDFENSIDNNIEIRE